MTSQTYEGRMIGGEEIDLENLVKESGSIKLSSRSGTENGSSLLAQIFRYILGSGHYFRKERWGKSGVFFRSSIHESIALWTSEERLVPPVILKRLRQSNPTWKFKSFIHL